MRTLVILRGATGCGKSTWVKNNGLEPYTLSADNLRLMVTSPIETLDGLLSISQKENNFVWNLLMEILEKRMKNGDFTIIDACHRKKSDFSKYKTLANKYRYKVVCVDFTNIDIKTCYENNSKRDVFRVVPHSVINKHYAAFENEKTPNWVKVILPNEIDKLWINKIDLSKYKKIVHIGDIHGCYKPLKKYIDFSGDIKDDTFYIFTGDYLDRGPDNDKVLRFLMDNMDRPNFCLLEGNHEKHLWNWANDEKVTDEFENFTAPQLLNVGITKKDVRIFCRKLIQMAWYNYNGNDVICCHGGIASLQPNPEYSVNKSLTLLSANEYIKGTGKYSDIEDVEEIFSRLHPSVYQLHGHRNKANANIINLNNDKCYNLEGGVERKGQLRIMEFSGIMKIHPVFVDNDDPDIERILVRKAIENFRNNENIKEKVFGNISSFNFTKDAFRHKKWDSETVKARGIFINTHTNDIVARSYDKFFNIDEREDTDFEYLKNTLKYPLTAYIKENGFLGILGWDKESDKPIFATKSTLHPENIKLTDSSINSSYAIIFKNIFYDTVSENNREKIFNYIRKYNCSFVFEVIDPVFDPHIIEYNENQIVLLDIILNQIKYDCFIDIILKEKACEFGLKCKETAYVINSPEMFKRLYDDANSKYSDYLGRKIEGYVIKDASYKMVKLKTRFYSEWKRIRSLLPVIFSIKDTEQLEKFIVKNEFDFEMACKIKYIFNNKEKYCLNTSIIQIRNDYLKSI